MLLDLWGLLQRNLFRGANSGKDRIVVVEIEGKEFRVPERSLQSFLKAFEKREVKRINKIVRNPTFKEKDVTVPTIDVIEVPEDYRYEVDRMLDNTAAIMESLVNKLRLRKMQDDEDEIILLLLGA